MKNALIVDCDGTLHSRQGINHPQAHVLEFIAQARLDDPDLYLIIWTGFGVLHGAAVAEKYELSADHYDAKSDLIALRKLLQDFDTVTVVDDDHALLKLMHQAFAGHKPEVFTHHPSTLLR